MAERKPKVAWSERLDAVRKQYPVTATLDWYSVFKADPAVAGRLIGDIIKNDGQEVKRPGKRAPLAPEIASVKLRQLQSEDYTDYSFGDAFRILAGEESIRNISKRTGIQTTRVFKLLKGRLKPSIEDIETVAKTYGKHPSYFNEYRDGYIVAMLSQMLEGSPETSMLMYKRLAGHSERKR